MALGLRLKGISSLQNPKFGGYKKGTWSVRGKTEPKKKGGQSWPPSCLGFVNGLG